MGIAKWNHNALFLILLVITFFRLGVVNYHCGYQMIPMDSLWCIFNFWQNKLTVFHEMYVYHFSNRVTIQIWRKDLLSLICVQLFWFVTFCISGFLPVSWECPKSSGTEIPIQMVRRYWHHLIREISLLVRSSYWHCCHDWHQNFWACNMGSHT